MTHAFYGTEFTFTQPNGEKLKVRGWGDQYSARFETLDGFTLVRNPANGFFEIARKADDGVTLESSGQRPNSKFDIPGIEPGLRPGPVGARRQAAASPLTGKTRWQQRHEQRRAFLRTSMFTEAPLPAPPQRETVGSFIGLCLPIQFPDVACTVMPDQISDFCNKLGYTDFGNNGSVRDYYLANSVGKCDYLTIVAPVFTAAHPRNYYADPSQTYSKRAQELIHEALAFHKNNNFDFSRLTSDSAHFVYAINAFYAGDVVNNWREGLWPHSHFLANQTTLASGKIAHDYQITALGDELALGTYCHENGHMLCDFPDLYDYDNDSAGIGKYCLMSGGNHADQKNPVQIGAYLKYRAGWTGTLTDLTIGLRIAAKITATISRFLDLPYSSTQDGMHRREC